MYRPQFLLLRKRGKGEKQRQPRRVGTGTGRAGIARARLMIRSIGIATTARIMRAASRLENRVSVKTVEA